jgi:anti-sigma factor RsiW
MNAHHGERSMKVTRDVVRDLLSVYLAGEASADTRAFVDSYLESDAELARQVEVARAGALRLPPTSPPAPAAEKQALDATRQLLKARTSTLVVATLFTLLPLTFVFKDSRVTFVLIRDAPVIGLAWWATAAVMWTWHILVRRRLRVSGL